jgi:serine/threonine protein kinase
MESTYLSILKGYGIPKIKSFGHHGNFLIMIQELLGHNLMQIRYQIKGFSIKDIAMMGIQIMDRIEYVHSKNFIHRDIKPENFVIGYNNTSTIYIIDFGISRKYRSSRTGKHLKFQLTG